MCRWGFSNMVETLQNVQDERVRAYVVWLPVLGGDFEGSAQELSDSFRDSRVRYYLDPATLTGNLWEKVLKTGREVAWDVYFLYGPKARWDQDPPIPDFWMHQLGGVTKAPRLDGPRFTEKLKEMLVEMDPSTVKPGPVSRGKMQVEFLFIDGCPSHKQALAKLRAALQKRSDSVELTVIEVTSESHAERVRFLGSPSIRVNGVDIEGRKDGFNYGCRLYEVGGKLTGTPSTEYIELRLSQLLDR